MDRVGLHHRIDRSGPRVVLLHPVGLDLTCFDALTDQLSRHHEVLRLARGHGGSPAAQPGAHLADYAADIHASLDDLDYRPAAVIGFSFGGMLAQVLALTYPSAVAALVVGACPSSLAAEVRPMMAARGAEAERYGMGAVVESTLERWFTQTFRARGADEPTRRRLLADDVHGWATAWRAIAELDTRPQLPSIRVPTLCLAGELDRAAPPGVVDEIAKAIPGARFEIVPGAPHMLFIEQPQAVAAAISAFLTDVV